MHTIKDNIIAGPCSAESYNQLENILLKLQNNSIDYKYLRAGVWKPRTSPGSFEGVGEIAFEWINELKNKYKFKFITEVASTQQVEIALNNQIDAIWIGARTTVNPFLVQEISDSLKGTDIPVFIKNPLSPDIGLWIGAIERFYKNNINDITLIHRGFYKYGENKYRNQPMWHLPVEMKSKFPKLLMYCDPSHIAGNRKSLNEIISQAQIFGLDGLMIEVHEDYHNALSDKDQQIDTDTLVAILNKINNYTNDNCGVTEIDLVREKINLVNNDLLDLLSQRMNYVKEIAQIKKSNNMIAYQADRWLSMKEELYNYGNNLGLKKEFIEQIMILIHNESFKIHNEIYNKE